MQSRDKQMVRHVRRRRRGREFMGILDPSPEIVIMVESVGAKVSYVGGGCVGERDMVIFRDASRGLVEEDIVAFLCNGLIPTMENRRFNLALADLRAFQNHANF